MGTVDSRMPVKITLKKHDNVKLVVPYKQLEMIKLLQSSYQYEVKGTLYFSHNHKFKSFEIRTDESEIYSSGASDWKMAFHTHPDKTAQKYGIRYYSPPSVEDVLEIYDYSQKYIPDSISETIGEISIIFANEGIYVLQVDRNRFKALHLHQLSEKRQEEMLQTDFNRFIVNFIKEAIRKLTSGSNFENPDISYKQLSTMIKNLSSAVTEKFGFKMMFYDWTELQKTGLLLNSNTYFVNRLAD